MNLPRVMPLFWTVLALASAQPVWGQFPVSEVTSDLFGFEGLRTAGPEEVRIYKKGVDGSVDRQNQPSGYPKYPKGNYTLAADEAAFYHNAIDFSTQGQPTEFKAGVYGTVVEARPGLIVVKTGNNDFIQYNHDLISEVKTNDIVTPTTPLGVTGRVGTAKIHFHIQAFQNGATGRREVIGPDTAVLRARTPLSTPLVPRAPALPSPVLHQGPLVTNGVVNATALKRFAYDDNAPKSLASGRVGGPPTRPNTGYYSKFSEMEGQVVPKTLPRSQRIEQNLRQPKNIWGGILVGKAPTSFPMALDAKWQFEDDQIKLLVKIDGRDDYAIYCPSSVTELWSAYHFLRPSPEMRDLGASSSDVGLISGLSVGTADFKTWLSTQSSDASSVAGDNSYVVHPAIANTSLAREAMRVDTVCILECPSFPILPVGYTGLEYYDEPGQIQVQGKAISVVPLSEPRSTILRVRFFLKNGHREMDWDILEHWYQKFDAFRTLDRFARTLAVLTWLETMGKLPELPAEVKPERINVPNRWHMADILVGTRTQIHGWLSEKERLKIHSAFLKQGETYRIELNSYLFGSWLTVQNDKGEILAQEEDTGPGTSSQLSFTPKKTQEYRLVVARFADKGGNLAAEQRPGWSPAVLLECPQMLYQGL